MNSNKIVAYTIEGKPLTLEEYNKRLAKAEKEILNGNVITQEELERESEKW